MNTIKMFLLSVLFTGMVYTGNAQVAAGTFAVGVNALPLFSEHMYGGGSNTNIEFMPNVNYFLKHNWSLHAGVGYNYQGTTVDGSAVSAVNNETFTYKTYTSLNGLPMQLGIRKWIPIKATKNHLAFIIEGSVNGEYSGTVYTASIDVLTPNYHDHIFTVGPQIAPGVSWFINSNWNIECMVGSVGYAWTTDKTVYTTGAPSVTTNSTKSYNNFSAAHWLLGVNYFFDPGMRLIAKKK